jgi:hypothetical protein
MRANGSLAFAASAIDDHCLNASFVEGALDRRALSPGGAGVAARERVYALSAEYTEFGRNGIALPAGLTMPSGRD